MAKSNPNQTNIDMKYFPNDKYRGYSDSVNHEYLYLTIPEICDHLDIGARRAANITDQSVHLVFNLYEMCYRVVREMGERELEETGWGFMGRVFGDENPVKYGTHYFSRHLFFGEPYKLLIENTINSCISIEQAYKELENIGEKTLSKFLRKKDVDSNYSPFDYFHDESGVTVCPDDNESQYAYAVRDY